MGKGVNLFPLNGHTARLLVVSGADKLEIPLLSYRENRVVTM